LLIFIGVFYPVIAGAVAFTLTELLLLSLGFGPVGIVAGKQNASPRQNVRNCGSNFCLSFGGLGSMAAAFQSWMYGAFTPAAGVFATLTSLGMLGLANPLFALISVIIATLAVWLTWSLQGCPIDGAL